MGAAIEVFEGASAVCVPRSRFAPVKHTNDLLVVRSDVYQLVSGFRLQVNPLREGELPAVDLDPDYYRFVSELDARFGGGAPSLLGCERLVVRGDVHFGADVVCRGDVRITNDSDNPRHVPDGTLLEGSGG